jgi:hypothetical protein
MYNQAPTNHRQRELLLEVRQKLTGIVSPDKVQPKITRVFSKLKSNDANAVFDFAERAKVMSGESLLKDARVVVGSCLALGIAKVPVIGGKFRPGNLRQISYPHPTFFNTALVTGNTTTELEAVRMFFNGLLTFKTDQEVRLENIPVTHFAIIEQTSTLVPEVLCPIDLQTTLILEGSTDNTLTIKFPDGIYDGIEGNPGDETAIGTHALYGVAELRGYEVVCSDAQRSTVAARLRTGR